MEVFKSWEVEAPFIVIVTVVRAGISDYGDIVFTRATSCNGGL